MPTSDMSKEVKVVVNGELLADSTASRKLFPPKVENKYIFNKIANTGEYEYSCNDFTNQLTSVDSQWI